MKSKYNLFQAILLAFIIPFTFTACDDDDKAVPESQVSWTLSLPEDIENPTLSDLKVTITNINTNTQYDGSVSMNEQTVTVTATVTEGLYRVIAEGKVRQLLMENSGKVVPRDMIMDKLWESDSFIDDNTLTEIGRAHV